MKSKLLFLSMISLCFLGTLKAQTANDYIKEAQTFIGQKNYKEAQASLQMAISEVYKMMGADVVASLPKEIGTYKSDPANDQVNTSGMSMLGGGFTITREYRMDEEHSARVSVLGNSPMLASVNMMLNNPMFMNQSGSSQKMIRIGTAYKGLLDYHLDTKNGTLSIPFTASLVTIDLNGFADEKSILEFVQKLNLDGIKKALGE